MAKTKKEKVAGSGGIIAMCGFIMGVLLYIAYIVFVLGGYDSHLIEILGPIFSSYSQRLWHGNQW